ncbi:MAG TPA: TlpA disulfide reductase family protein [Solirubrobacteraceae bacterium]|nr:TlpA disulfide reductase family protein [Solirubrobacteraceae bacterium]
MTPRSWLLSIFGLVLAVLLVVGLVQLLDSAHEAQPSAPLTPAQIRARLAGSPAPLAALHAQADELLPGGARALRARLAALHGYPLVINKWASWCTPCQAERVEFERASVALGRSVAFIGIDSADTSIAAARAFLRAVPVAYPSYYDHSGHLGEAITDSSFTPVTVFYDRAGGEYIHQGPYPSLAKLQRDIRRYALD